MGQKVNPHGLRVGIIKDWDSKWYAESDFADFLVEDYNIRTFLKKKLYASGVSKISFFHDIESPFFNMEVLFAKLSLQLTIDFANLKERLTHETQIRFRSFSLSVLSLFRLLSDNRLNSSDILANFFDSSGII